MALKCTPQEIQISIYTATLEIHAHGGMFAVVSTARQEVIQLTRVSSDARAAARAAGATSPHSVIYIYLLFICEIPYAC